MKIKINPNIVLKKLRHIFHTTKSVVILFGSASSGKSYQVMFFAVLWALQGRNILIARKELNQVRRSVWLEVTKAISRHNLDAYFEIKLSQYTIISKVSGGSIVFTGVDDENKLKSITPPQGTAFDMAIMEEADAFTGDEFDQIRTRMRGLTKFKKTTILLFNPVSIMRLRWCWERFFVKQANWNDESDSFFENDEILIQRAIYQDNKYLAPDDMDKFDQLKRDNPKKFRVFGEGKFGASGKTVFDVNKYRKSDFNVHDMLAKGYKPMFGSDFGFVHASTMMFCLWDKRNNTIYVCDMVYEKGKTKEELAPLFVALLDKYQYSRSVPVLCDYAEPAAITTLQNNGVIGAVRCARKDVVAQTDFLQSQTVVFNDANCNQAYEEMQALNFKVVGGNVTEDWDDSYGDDALKGICYGFSYEALRCGVSAMDADFNI